MITHIADSAVPRLDRFLADRHPDIPRSKWDGWVKSGQVRVNGVVATKGGTRLRVGDTVECEAPELVAPAQHLVAEDLHLPTLFEDERIWIVDKPSGMVVHPGPGHQNGTVVNALLWRLQAANRKLELDGIETAEEPEDEDLAGPVWPGLVHRLDRYTSGCLCLSKDAEAQRNLQAQFKARTVEKRYLAIVRASRKLPELGSLLIDAGITRHRVDRLKMVISATGRPSQTRVKVLAKAASMALVECELLTGRTHQIRVHLAHLGAPLLGDTLYGGASRWQNAAKEPVLAPHPALHAWKLAVDHPTTGARIKVVAPLPEQFLALIEKLGLEWKA